MSTVTQYGGATLMRRVTQHVKSRNTNQSSDAIRRRRCKARSHPRPESPNKSSHFIPISAVTQYGGAAGRRGITQYLNHTIRRVTQYLNHTIRSHSHAIPVSRIAQWRAASRRVAARILREPLPPHMLHLLRTQQTSQQRLLLTKPHALPPHNRCCHLSIFPVNP